jgi:hypothetical protein
MRRLELYAEINSAETTLGWCRSRALIAVTVPCPECGNPMKEQQHSGEDGYIWACRRRIDGSNHARKVSVRALSFFSGSMLSIRQQIYLIYEWAVKTTVEGAAHELSISEKTVGKFYKYLRQVVSDTQQRNQSCIIGGFQKMVEVDECQIGRRKHHRGRVPQEIWIFGAVERDSNPLKCLIEVVDTRNRHTLEEVIRRRIISGSTILSDGWRAYAHLSSLGYDHKVVNHSQNFVSPLDSTIHTQNVENLWRCLRRFLSTKGTYTRRHLTGFINEFIFRKSCLDPFETILSLIAAQFRVDAQ